MVYDIRKALCRFAGKIPLYHSMDWPYGKIETILLSNFQNKMKEYHYLHSRYPDVLELSGRRNEEEERQYRYRNFHYLSSIRDCDRLDIIGHSNGSMIGRFDHETLAEELAFYSLKRVGVIKFQACYTGRGSWLEKIRTELFRRNISFAYMVAPMGKVNWNNPFVKYITDAEGPNYRVVKGNINKIFDNVRYG